MENDVSIPRAMRRADRAITDLPGIVRILEQCPVMRLGMTGPEGPYVVPLNFGYAEKDGALTLFFHCAPAGRKTDMLHADARVCFEADCGHRLMEGATPCAYSYGYESVIGFGKARLLVDENAKAEGLSHIMSRLSSCASFKFDPAVLERTAVYAIDVENVSGKHH